MKIIKLNNLNKREKEQEAYEQYLREKDEVQKVMNALIQSEMSQLAMRETQKKNAFVDMQIQLDIKAQRKRE